MNTKTKALVVLSGGQDSATCLAWAIAQGYDCHTITFDYGQKHAIEIDSAFKVARILGIPPHKMELVKLGDNVLAGTSPLTNKAVELEQYADHASLPGGLEKTFVPMRNQLFLTVAANRAYVLGCNVLVTGVCQEDSGGYPDCRASFISALQDAINYGTFTGEPGTLPPLAIKTPLMYLTKAKSVLLAQTLPYCMAALAHSHTSYDGQYPPVGKDHATLLRAKGFEEAGVPDPLVLRAVREGKMEPPATDNYSAEAIDAAWRKERETNSKVNDAKWDDLMSGRLARSVTVHDHFDVPGDCHPDDAAKRIAQMNHYVETGELPKQGE